MPSDTLIAARSERRTAALVPDPAPTVDQAPAPGKRYEDPSASGANLEVLAASGFELLLSFRAVGHPKGQPRVKACIRGNHAGVYTPQLKGDWKGDVIRAARRAKACVGAPAHLIAGPIRLDIDFIFARPKSHFRTGRNAHLLRDDAPIEHTQKPDRDNAEKLILDVLTLEGFWRDDCQVCAGEPRKRWAEPGEKPGARVTVSVKSDGHDGHTMHHAQGGTVHTADGR